MLDKLQMDAWITGSSAYCRPPLKGMIDNPVWTSDPVHEPYSVLREPCVPMVTLVPWVMPRRRRWRIMSWSTWWPRLPRGSVRPRQLQSARRAASQPLLSRLTNLPAVRKRRPFSPLTTSEAFHGRCRTFPRWRDDRFVRTPLLQSKVFLGLLFMPPAAIPVGLSLLSARARRLARIHRHAHWPLRRLSLARKLPAPWDDSLFWLSVFNTILYTVVASILKFMLGLWLALLLNEHIPFKAFIRAIVLLPWVVPTVLSAIAFWWIYDTQFSIISWALMKIGWISSPINFL